MSTLTWGWLAEARASEWLGLDAWQWAALAVLYLLVSIAVWWCAEVFVTGDALLSEGPREREVASRAAVAAKAALWLPIALLWLAERVGTPVWGGVVDLVGDARRAGRSVSHHPAAARARLAFHALTHRLGFVSSCWWDYRALNGREYPAYRRCLYAEIVTGRPEPLACGRVEELFLLDYGTRRRWVELRADPRADARSSSSFVAQTHSVSLVGLLAFVGLTFQASCVPGTPPSARPVPAALQVKQVSCVHLPIRVDTSYGSDESGRPMRAIIIFEQCVRFEPYDPRERIGGPRS
jgi:hypothetical protein